MRICVITGGTGGIGLHLCEGFQRAGYAVAGVTLSLQGEKTRRSDAVQDARRVKSEAKRS